MNAKKQTKTKTKMEKKKRKYGVYGKTRITDCQKAAKKWELVDTNTAQEWLDWAEKAREPHTKTLLGTGWARDGGLGGIGEESVSVISTLI
ncbi:uncharacterized protein TRIREDRAFT_108975 [Trichoderma reesei QM6a]|uniref:Predicted protein n=2 Tax=Hypocrea jecorina TaxID=51453 RepID=G0RNH1_HYPJQ|nr:uncharacterized protein TRIREDRAFT_108975 [Trichoderma reesei QM6a]EGR47159.1 predicted protein [Trichoderma reesei QM6a]ETS00587.1 hypothetical protein M419DRAFT_131234 [Trichoderma reesei RUT C-30]